MQCSSCGTQLPEGATFCPARAALTPYGSAQSRATPYDPTVTPSSSRAPLYTPSTPDYFSPTYEVSWQNPYEPRNPYTTPGVSTAPSPVHPPSSAPRSVRNRSLLTVSIVVACVIAAGGIVGLLVVRGVPPVSANSTPTPVPYPSLAKAYSGIVDNTTYNQKANMALTSIVQNNEKINGQIQFGLPLIGSGPFAGTVSLTGAIQFVVSSGDQGGAMLTFSGSISQGSIGGTYTVSGGQRGTWNAAPAASPVVYPMLSPNYTGNFHNNSTSKDGTLTLTIVTQEQQNFTGFFDSRNALNGTFGANNSIQIFTTDTNGQPLAFNGTVNIDQSLSGTYTASEGVTGTWKVEPV